MAGPHNRAVACPICHEKFFPKSLPFHVKQCEKRRRQTIVPCPYCGKEVSQLDLPQHIGECPKNAASRAAKQTASQSASASTAPSGQGSMEEGRYDPEVAEDGRMRCVHCGRLFNSDRIDKHQQICGKLKSARPTGVDGEKTQCATKVYDASAQRTGQGSAFVSAKQFERKQQEKQQSTQKPKTGNWKRQHEEFQAVCRAGRGEEPPPPAKPKDDGLIPCPHCGRRFQQHAADRHIPICAKVVNRPKAPPKPSRMPPSPNVSSRTWAPDSHETTPKASSSSRARGGNETMRESVSCRQLPDVDAPPRSERSAGSSSSRVHSSGSGLKAARSLRQSESSRHLETTDRLPRVDSQRSPASGQMSGTLRGQKSSPEMTVRRSPGSATRQIDEASSTFNPGTMHATQKIGLRRSAILYRLLSQVPQDSLAKELGDCGIAVDGMDQEGMIEAIVEQLA